jgi:hypothetical protein
MVRVNKPPTTPRPPKPAAARQNLERPQKSLREAFLKAGISMEELTKALGGKPKPKKISLDTLNKCHKDIQKALKEKRSSWWKKLKGWFIKESRYKKKPTGDYK